MIGAGEWIKKAKVKNYRAFYFAASTEEERDEWITVIELLKANAVHKSFQNSYCKIALPLNEESSKRSIGYSNINQNPLSTMSLKQAFNMTTYDDKRMGGRRPTSFGKSILTKLPSSLSATNSEKNEYDYKEKAKILFNYSVVHFLSYMFQHSLGKMNDKPFCVLPEIAAGSDILKLIERNARESDARPDLINGLLSSKHEETKAKTFPDTGSAVSPLSILLPHNDSFDSQNKNDGNLSKNENEKPFQSNSSLSKFVPKSTRRSSNDPEEDKRMINPVKEEQESESNDEDNNKIISYRNPTERNDKEIIEEDPTPKKSAPNDITEKKGKKKVFTIKYPTVVVNKTKRIEQSIDMLKNSQQNNLNIARSYTLTQSIAQNQLDTENNIESDKPELFQQIPSKFNQTVPPQEFQAFQEPKALLMKTVETKKKRSQFTEESLMSYSKIMNAFNKSLVEEPELAKPLFNDVSDIAPIADTKAGEGSNEIKASKFETDLTADTDSKQTALVVEKTKSRGGDIFELEPGSLIIIEKIMKAAGIAKCSFNGLSGLFPLSCLKIGVNSKKTMEAAVLTASKRDMRKQSKLIHSSK